uniref:Uncharacterized protein n=2 Tax=Leersia perrieri TaxID=77586 RepID=A0A0D9WXD5_9ORYZ
MGYTSCMITDDGGGGSTDAGLISSWDMYLCPYMDHLSDLFLHFIFLLFSFLFLLAL